MKRLLLSGLLVFGCYLLISSLFSARQAFNVMKPYEDCYMLTLDDPVTLDQESVRKFSEQNEELTFTLFSEAADESLNNKEFNRSTAVTMLFIYGNSGLLFHGENPLTQEDTDGCLISEGTAWDLFGNTNVVGKEISYGEKKYYIRGVIKEASPLCVLEADKNMILGQLIVKANSEIREDTIKDKLQNKYNLSGKESKAYWERIPVSLNDWKELGDELWYLIIKANNYVEVKSLKAMLSLVKSIAGMAAAIGILSIWRIRQIKHK